MNSGEAVCVCGHVKRLHLPHYPQDGDVPGTLATCQTCLDLAMAERLHPDALFEKCRHPFQPVCGEGLLALLGERVTLFGLNYIYTGKLTGVNDTCVLLEDAGIVYETGPFDDKDWKDYQPLPGTWYVQTSAIESFGILK